jgi:hypothetical protein
MAQLGALSPAWVSAEASLPLGWQVRGLYRFEEGWISVAEGPALAKGSVEEQCWQAIGDFESLGAA